MHVFFDLDGTLTNPKEGIAACIRHALTALAAPIPADADLNQWIGPPLQESFLAVLQCPDRAAQAVTLYRDRFATIGLFENQVYDGIVEMLSGVSTVADRLWVTTSKPQIFAEKIVQHFQLAPFFAKVYGSELDGTRANKADLLAYVLHREGIEPAEVVMVGDRYHDILGAQKNGIPAIGVMWGFGSAMELQEAGATLLCQTPGDLPNILRTLHSRG
ncbi:MAG: HAD family hydrolase [Leptolyngbya sp. SIO1E4]|nr:HAD family hydrolase [Leptolyngbya sp. SIO1E4]